jgi:hypothetical protein
VPWAELAEATPEQVDAAVRTAAAAFTRASLLLANGAEDELEEDQDGAASVSL